MLIFISLNLTVTFIFKLDSSIGLLFRSEFALYFGIGLLLLNFIATAIKFKRIPYKLRYDLFAVGAFLVWFSYWPSFFRMGAPIFDVFPLYFAFISALFSLLFITKRENMDPDAVIFMQWLSDSGRFNPLVIMLGVMVSLAFPQHFLLFPIMITLWVTRFALACSLNNE